MLKILKINVNKENYTSREESYSSIHSLEELYRSYLNIEPHTFLHAGIISNTISKKQLNGVSAI